MEKITSLIVNKKQLRFLLQNSTEHLQNFPKLSSNNKPLKYQWLIL